MTPTSKGYPHTPTPKEIEDLAAEVERNPTDLVNKITLANALEQTGEVLRAATLYQEVIAQDREGNLSPVARKALENLKNYGYETDVSLLAKSSRDLQTQENIPNNATTTLHSQHLPRRFKSTSSWFSSWWKNLSFRTKLAILLIASTALPVFIVTQAIVAVTKESLFDKFKQSLQRDSIYFTEDFVTWNVDEARNETNTIAQLVQTTQIDLSNPQQVGEQRQLLQSFISNFRVADESESVEKNIRILTDAQGRTVAQYIQALAPESFNPKPDKLQIRPRYTKVSLPLGIYLGDIPIVKNVLKTGKQLSGMEVLRSDVLKRLGQDKQANIGVRSQPTKELPTSEQPFPTGTYDIDGGKTALVSMAVQPIKIGKKLVGTAIVGSIENRNSTTVDDFKSRGDAPLATVFAQDWRVSSNVPSTDGTRDIGTRAPRRVAETVLNQGKEFVGFTKIAGVDYLGVYQPLYDHQQELNPSEAKPVGMTFVRRSLAESNSLLTQQQITAYGILSGMLLISGALAIWIASSFARPLRRLASFAQAVGDGQQKVRLEDKGRQDEIGVLARNLNGMTANIEANLETIRQQEALQRREKEHLQQGMINLLLETETVKQGDLTVRVNVSQGETGAIADAFNVVISSLRSIVIQVQTAANQVQTSAVDSVASVQRLATEATTQAGAVDMALSSVEQMDRSIQAIAASAQTAAAVAHIALDAAQNGDRDMDRTVGSIDTIRASVAQTTKKAKRLAESAQEISKIISIISGISEKTNILAFNAAIEASKAGENGQGFRIVATEVRRLAQRVTDSSKEIEQLVDTIQQGTSDVLKTMEISNAQVANGTQLVGKTKQTLQGLAQVSQEIDQLLQSISSSTVSQAENSKMVNQTMQTVSAIASSNSADSETVLSTLQELLEVAQKLQNSVSRFRVEK